MAGYGPNGDAVLVIVVTGVAGYSHQTFPWTICRSVQCIVEKRRIGSGSPDAVWHHRSDGSRDEAGGGVWGSVHGKGYFWGEFGARHSNQWGLTFAATRPSSQITLGTLVIVVDNNDAAP